MNSRQRKNFIIFMVTLLLISLIPAPYEAEETTAFPQLVTQPGAAKLDLTDPSLEGNKSKGPKKPFEEITLRKENEKIINNHDGTYTKRIFTKPVHIKKGNVWEEISTELIEQNGSEYKPKNTELAVSFKKEMLNGNYAQFNHEEHTFLVRLVQASGEQGTRKVNSVISTVEGNKIWYKQVFPSIDLRSIQFNDSVKEDIVLNKYTGQNEFQFEITTNLIAESEVDGSITFKDVNGKEIYSLPKPFMSDSNINAESGESATSENVSYDIKKSTSNTYTLKIIADKEWLKDSKRKFPIYIDPTVVKPYKNFVNAYVSNAYPTTNYSGSRLWDAGQGAYVLKVGNYDGTTGDNYAYLKNSLTDLKGAIISKATLWLYTIWSYSTSPTNVWVSTAKTDWSPSTITWNNSPSVTNLGYAGAVRNSWFSFDTTSTVQNWVNNLSSNFGFALHTNGNGQSYWKKFIASENSTNVPEIDITYYYPKPVVTSVSNGPGKEAGYFNLSWNPVQGAASYDVAIYNGSEYQTINVGSSTSWTTKDKGIWPTKEELEKGIYKLHSDQKGAEFALDPSTVYANAYNANGGADYSNSHQYWIHIIARFSDGSVAKTQDADAWMQLGTPVPKGTLFPNLANAKTGYAQLEWEPIPGATGYKVLIYNGKAYEEFDVQNNTNWTSQGENIWPTDAEIEAGKYLLHHDKNGQDLARDPSPVYVNSKGIWGTSKDYWIAVKAYSNLGYPDSARSLDFEDIFPTDDLSLGMKDYWAQIPIKDGIVNAVNGNLVISDTDYELTGLGPDISIVRTYNSQDKEDGLFGKGWFSTLDKKVIEGSDGNVNYLESDKGIIRFIKLNTDSTTGNTIYQGPLGLDLSLTKDTAKSEFRLKENNQTTSGFYLDGRLKYLEDGYGKRVTFNYDSNNKLKDITNAAGKTINIILTPDQKHIWKVVGLKSDTIIYDINSDGYLNSVTSVEGNVTIYKYTNGNLTIYDPKHTVEKPVVTNFQFSNGQLIVNDPIGNVTSLLFELDKKQVTVTNPKFNKDIIYYNDAGNKTKKIVDYGPSPHFNLTTTYEYKLNQLIKTTDPRSQIDSFSYDTNGNILTSQDAIGTASYQYNENNDVTSMTDTDGKVTTTSYDGLNSVSNTDESGKMSSVTQYNVNNNPTADSKSLAMGTNLIRNASFEEDNTNWTLSKVNDTGSLQVVNVVDTMKSPGLGGNKVLKLSSLSSSSSLGYVAAVQDISVKGNQTYSLSSWIKTDQITNGNVFLNVEFFDGYGAHKAWKDNRYFKTTGTKGWSEKKLTFTTTPETQKIRVYLEIDHTNGLAKGTAYFDKIQLDEGAVSSSFNPISNSSFEGFGDTNDETSGWEKFCSPKGCGMSGTDTGFDGNKSIYFQRENNLSPDSNYFKELIINQTEPQSITLTGMSKAENVENSGGNSLNEDYSIWADVSFKDGTNQSFKAMFPLGTTEWNRSAVYIDAQEQQKKIDTIKVYTIFRGDNTGKVWFDAIRILEGNVLTRNEYYNDGIKDPSYIKKVFNEMGKYKEYDYDKSGNKTVEIDEVKNITNYEYYLDDKLKNVTLPNVNKTKVKYFYDKNGNVEKKETNSEETTPEGITHTQTHTNMYKYNGNNQIEEFEDPLHRKTNYHYDDSGNLEEIITANNKIIRKDYDTANRLEFYKYDQLPIFEYKYDANGNETEVYDYSSGQRQLLRSKNHDLANRLKTMSERGGLLEWNYYDNSTNLKDITYNHGNLSNTTSYDYNLLNQNIKVVDNNQAYYWDYNEFGNISTYILGNGTGTQFTYDERNNLKTLTVGDDKGVNIFSELYTYDDRGNRTKVLEGDDRNVKSSYEYDSLSQLKKETYQNDNGTFTTKEYDYDGFGNRKSVTVTEEDKQPQQTTATFDDANQLRTFGSDPIDYDDNGNRISDASYNYKWDEDDQLIAIKDKSDKPILSFKYDDKGRRIEKKNEQSESITKFYYDGDSINVLYETSGTGTVLRSYVYSATGGRLAMKTYSNGLISGTYYYHYNSHGDVIAITDGTGKIVDKYKYDAWGNLIGDLPSIGNLFTYAGYMYDSETGLYYLMARYYDPKHGVFISMDPDPGDDDDPITQNGYSYANNNPVIHIDPDGNSTRISRAIGPMGMGGFVGKLGKFRGNGTGKAAGQVHHLLSNKIMRALNNHPTLKGKFNREDPMFKYRAKDLNSHKGYQKWHREYDAKVVGWLGNNPRATVKQFKKYLNDLHKEQWLKSRIPNVMIK